MRCVGTVRADGDRASRVQRSGSSGKWFDEWWCKKPWTCSFISGVIIHIATCTALRRRSQHQEQQDARHERLHRRRRLPRGPVAPLCTRLVVRELLSRLGSGSGGRGGPRAEARWPSRGASSRQQFASARRPNLAPRLSAARARPRRRCRRRRDGAGPRGRGAAARAARAAPSRKHASGVPRRAVRGVAARVTQWRAEAMLTWVRTLPRVLTHFAWRGGRNVRGLAGEIQAREAQEDPEPQERAGPARRRGGAHKVCRALSPCAADFTDIPARLTSHPEGAFLTWRRPRLRHHHPRQLRTGPVHPSPRRETRADRRPALAGWGRRRARAVPAARWGPGSSVPVARRRARRRPDRARPRPASATRRRRSSTAATRTSTARPGHLEADERLALLAVGAARAAARAFEQIEEEVCPS